MILSFGGQDTVMLCPAYYAYEAYASARTLQLL